MSRHFKATKSSELSLAPYGALYTAVAAFGDFEQMWIVMYTGYFFTGPAPKVLSVEDCKNKKKESEANFLGGTSKKTTLFKL